MERSSKFLLSATVILLFFLTIILIGAFSCYNNPTCSSTTVDWSAVELALLAAFTGYLLGAGIEARRKERNR
jgi:hypothetical protein